MYFARYQSQAMRTAPEFPTKDNQLSATALIIGALGAAGEAGELANKVKKRIYHGHDDIDADVLADEIGDVLWYLAMLSSALGMDLGYIAEQNIVKLGKRYPAGFSEDASRNREV